MRRVRWMVPALFVLATLPGCFQVLGGDVSALRGDVTEPAPSEPEIDIWLNGAGGDSIDVWYGGPSSERFEIAEGVAAWLGAPNAIAAESDFFPDTATVQVTGHFAQERGQDWIFEVDTAGLRDVLAAANIPEATLVICYPHVDPAVASPVPPDLGFDDVACDFDGRGWFVASSDEPFEIRVTLRPDPAVFLTYAAAVLLGVVLFGALAWWIGDRLRRGPFRRRNAASVALGLIAGAFAGVGLGAMAAVIGVATGAGDNLALARHLTAGGLAAAIAFPALIATAPGVVVATCLIRQRPWSDEADALPVPPPSTPSEGGVAAPPLPWEPR